MGYVYIMTNPALRDMVKIGLAADTEQCSAIKAGGLEFGCKCESGGNLWGIGGESIESSASI